MSPPDVLARLPSHPPSRIHERCTGTGRSLSRSAPPRSRSRKWSACLSCGPRRMHTSKPPVEKQRFLEEEARRDAESKNA
jgi:hypothetical protein